MQYEELQARLSRTAADLDHTDHWPVDQLKWLADADVLRWVIPTEYGGHDIDQSELIRRYVELADSCLTTTFILTQRNGGCQRLAGSTNESLKQRLLPDLATGELFTTVGISHLTTSRQHLKQPAVQATELPDGFLLDGFVPWITGAAHADVIVTGGTLADGRQVLVALPRDSDGVEVLEHVQLLSLTSSHTTSIKLHRVRLPKDHLVAGPVEGVMQVGQGGGAGSLVTSALAVGLAQRCLGWLREETSRRPELGGTLAAFEKEFDQTRILLHDAADGAPEATGEPLSPGLIRQRANSLALRITQAALAVSKGSGFVSGHPAERAVREAMFFLVWSCPQPVVSAALAELACVDD